MNFLGLFLFSATIIAVGILQWNAFCDGSQILLNWDIILSFVVYIASFMFGLSALAAPIVFYGAFFAWEWTWYGAALLAVPGIIITFILIKFGGYAGLFAKI